MLAERQLRRDAMRIFRAALAAADPREAILRHVRVERDVLVCDKKRYRLDRFRRVFVVGAGKRARRWLPRWRRCWDGVSPRASST